MYLDILKVAIENSWGFTQHLATDFYTLSYIVICIAGVVVGFLALQRHKAAGLLTIVGWGMVVLQRTFLAWEYYFYTTLQEILGLSVGEVARFLGPFDLLFLVVSLAAYICIFLGIYLLLKKTTSQDPFFSLQYSGLDLRTEKESGS